VWGGRTTKRKAKKIFFLKWSKKKFGGKAKTPHRRERQRNRGLSETTGKKKEGHHEIKDCVEWSVQQFEKKAQRNKETPKLRWVRMSPEGSWVGGVVLWGFP